MSKKQIKQTKSSPAAEGHVQPVFIRQYRIIKKYNGFFREWCYYLEMKKTFWIWSWWVEVAGNALTRHIPAEWERLNIVERIELPIGV